jgi:hypothetical protein
MEAVKNAVIRAIRTFFQAALGVFLATLPVSGALGDLTAWTIVGPAVFAGIVAVLMNIAETIGGNAPYNRG